MKKFGIALLVAAVLAACNVAVVVEGPPPGLPVTVDDVNGVQAVLPAGAKERFELTVADRPVRVDVYHDEAAAEKELYVKVFDEDGQPYAHTDVRSYFQDADVDLASLAAVGAQDVDVSFPYSVNLPANMGKVYVEVTNQTAASATVTVKAVTRNEVVRRDVAMSNPDTANGETSKGYGGAVLFLGQRDTYVYEGEDNYHLTFSVPEPGTDVLRVRLKLQETGEVFEPGQAVVLLNGDVLEVYAEGDVRAGFCASYDGCSDGIETGEYSLTIEP
ncbi:hypothetical protein [Oceanithermus sp.]